MQNLAERVDDIIVSHDSGTLVNRPTSTPESPGVEGRLYRVTSGDNVGVAYRDTGAGWVVVGTAIDQQGTLAARLAANAVPQGTYYFATDADVTYRSDGTSWFLVGGSVKYGANTHIGPTALSAAP